MHSFKKFTRFSTFESNGRTDDTKHIENREAPIYTVSYDNGNTLKNTVDIPIKSRLAKNVGVKNNYAFE